MPHLHTNPGEHDHVVNAYIVRLDTDEPQALLHMHRKLGKLLSIGGHIELHENPWQSIAHELTEESGYKLDELMLLQPKDHFKSASGALLHPVPVASNTHQYGDLDHYHTETSYAFVAHADPSGSVGEGESTDLRWMTSEQLDEVDDSEIVPYSRELYKHIFEVCRKNWEQVDPGEFRL